MLLIRTKDPKGFQKSVFAHNSLGILQNSAHNETSENPWGLSKPVLKK
jgi:hypothetical protein